MKLISRRELINHIYDDYITEEKTIGDCIEDCHTFTVDEDRLCEICKSKDCEGCPLIKEMVEE